MKNITIISLLSFCCLAAHTQTLNDSIATKKSKPYIGIVEQMNNLKLKGWFFTMSEDSVYLLSSNTKLLEPSMYNNPFLMKETVAIPVTNINSISFKKKNAGFKGALIGLGTGALVGMIVGFAGGDDPVQPYTGGFGDLFVALGNAFAMTAGEKAAMGALSGGILGAGTGAILGAVLKKKFVIGSDKAVYNNLHDELMKKVYIPNEGH